MPVADPGTRVGSRYLLGPVLGRGATAVVHQAVDERLGRSVAVKLLGDIDDAELARHQGELAALSRLSHPNVVVLHDAGSEDGATWIALELVVGRSLADVIADGPLDQLEAARIGAAVARGAAAAHRAGIIHRDIKPGNVLLGKDGQVKVTDFGIARIEGEARQTRTGTVIGTAAFLSPEQVAGTEVSPASDVYALGLVLLEALTGRREFVGSTVEQALARLHRDPYIPDSLMPAWRDVLRACTARAPADRPTAAEVADRLTKIAADGPTVSGVPTRTGLVEGAAAAGASGAALASAPAATATRVWRTGDHDDSLAVAEGDGAFPASRRLALTGLGAAASLVLVLLLVSLLSVPGDSTDTVVTGPSPDSVSASPSPPTRPSDPVATSQPPAGGFPQPAASPSVAAVSVAGSGTTTGGQGGGAPASTRQQGGGTGASAGGQGSAAGGKTSSGGGKGPAHGGKTKGTDKGNGKSKGKH